MTVALPEGFPSPNNDPAYWCHRFIQVTNAASTATVGLQITDIVAAGGLGPYDLDITAAAFDILVPDRHQRQDGAVEVCQFDFNLAFSRWKIRELTHWLSLIGPLAYD